MSTIIPVKINDERIWNPLQTAAKITLALKNNESIVIDCMSEAPNLIESGLADFLFFLKNQGLDISKLSVRTGNMTETVDGLNIIRMPSFMFELPYYQKMYKEFAAQTKDIQYTFGHFVARTTLPRLIISSYLYKHYPEKTWQTFHWRHDDDYHKTHLELEKLLHLYGVDSPEAQDAWHLLQHSPLLKESVSKYPILHPEHVTGVYDWYQYFFVDVVCETWYQGSNFFLTEKFWRAVMTRTPFIIHGPQWVLENIKRLGFKTFDQWWDEGYSQDPGEHRLVEIKKVIDSLGSKTIPELRGIYCDMQSVLDHNFDVFMNLSYQKIGETQYV